MPLPVDAQACRAADVVAAPGGSPTTAGSAHSAACASDSAAVGGAAPHHRGRACSTATAPGRSTRAAHAQSFRRRLCLHAPALPEAAPEGTVVFSGLRAVPRVEAKISEKKPDGTWGRTIPIAKETFIGRENCDLSYPQDMLLSPRHASVAIRDGKLVLKDLNSQNGSFIRQRQDTELIPGDIFLLGRELFRFVTEAPGRFSQQGAPRGTMVWSVPKLQKGPLTAKLEHIKLNGEVVGEFKLDKPETTLGRTTGDLVFKDDPYMSGSHARIVAQPGRFILQDLRSRNGVYRRVRAEIDLARRRRILHGRAAFPRGFEERGVAAQPFVEKYSSHRRTLRLGGFCVS